jgi:hypothetical protein
MAMVGHKTEISYRRYSIVDHAILTLGTDRLDALHRRQASETLSKARCHSAGTVPQGAS